MEGWFSGLYVALLAACLLLGPVVHAMEMNDLTEKLPRAYVGEFRWDGDAVVQNVVITFEQVRSLDERNAEALGCGVYEDGRQVTKIKVRMFVRLSDRQVEIFERSPDGTASFETGGSHRGTLSEDLQGIDAQWTTSDSGRRGQLHLRAASSATCAPATSL
ncbi:hypothetical protein [Bradyrhizobium liaoningense]|uniref:hypothetical protein n=1 Tax=Bradyrhizobium liaoningense TaxID=43992 RepID=UPI00201327A4|nr:hypothetical protein [Bradyrhizobium liaoningense]